MRIALAAANMTKEVTSRKQLVSRVMRMALDAEGCTVLVLPEYFPMLALNYAPEDLKPNEEIPWLAEEMKEIGFAGEVENIAAAFDLTILAGTWPVSTADGYKNRAFVITEDGVHHVQDKMALTDEEKDRMGWYLKPGKSLDIFDLFGVTCAVSICHDTTFKDEFETFKKEGVQLVFMPSMCEMEGNTKVADSHAFIFDHARKRSGEVGCYFACVGSIGIQEVLGRVEKNVGGAALYHLGTGLAEIGPFEKGRGTSSIMLKVDVDV